MANAALRTLSMPVDSLTAQPISALPDHFQIQFLTAWQCDWWQPAWIPLAGPDAAITVCVNCRYEACFFFDLSVSLHCRGHNVLLILLPQSVTICQMLVRSQYGESCIWPNCNYSKQRRSPVTKKQANAEPPANAPDYNAMELWEQSKCYWVWNGVGFRGYE